MNNLASLREITILTGAMNEEQTAQLRGYLDMLFYPHNRKVECFFDCPLNERYVKFITEGSDIEYPNNKLEEIVNWTRFIVGNVNVEFIIQNRKEIFLADVGTRADRGNVDGKGTESPSRMETGPQRKTVINRPSNQNASPVPERIRLRANRHRVQRY